MTKTSKKRAEKSKPPISKPLSNAIVKKLNKVAPGFIPEYRTSRSNKTSTPFQNVHTNGYAKRDSQKDSLECGGEVARLLGKKDTTVKVSCSVLLEGAMVAHTFMLTHRDEHLIVTDCSADCFYAESNFSYRVIVDTAASLLGLPITFFHAINDETKVLYDAINSHIEYLDDPENICALYCQAVVSTGILHKLSIKRSNSSSSSSSSSSDDIILIDLLNA